MADENMFESIGITYSLGIKNFAGRDNIYEKYLGRFIQDDHYEKAKEALEKNEYQEVLFQMHALKGIAGTLGMKGLLEASSAVVTAIRRDTVDEVSGLFQRVTEDYDRIVAGLSELM